jgi:hypothetical protein
LQNVRVASYLDDPKDAVTISAGFAQLPDGTNHVANTLINGESKQLTVNNQNFELSEDVTERTKRALTQLLYPIPTAGFRRASAGDMSDVERKLALERYKLLEPHLQHGRELRSVSEGSDVSFRTLQRWVAGYKREGLAGLVRKGRIVPRWLRSEPRLVRSYQSTPAASEKDAATKAGVIIFLLRYQPRYVSNQMELGRRTHRVAAVTHALKAVARLALSGLLAAGTCFCFSPPEYAQQARGAEEPSVPRVA